MNENFKIQNNLAPKILNNVFNLSDTLGKLKNHNSFLQFRLIGLHFQSQFPLYYQEVLAGLHPHYQ